MIKIGRGAIQQRLTAQGARIVSLGCSFEGQTFNGQAISAEASFQLPELDAGQHTFIKTDEGQHVYIGASGLWYGVDGLTYGGTDDRVEVFDSVFGDNEATLRDSAFALCMDKFYNSAIIGSEIVKPVDFPLYALLTRGWLSVTSRVNDDVAAFRNQVWNITLDHIVDHWRVPLMDIDALRDVYYEWATWRKMMLAPHIDGSDFNLEDETDGLSFEDPEIIEHLQHNKHCFVDNDLDRGNVYLPSVAEIEAVDTVMYNVEQLQDDGEAVYPSRIEDIARAWSKYEEARQKASSLQ